jgi:hypothetical protein
MKKYLILITALCLCFSLVAAEGEAEAETKKRAKTVLDSNKFSHWAVLFVWRGIVLYAFGNMGRWNVYGLSYFLGNASYCAVVYG